MAIGFGVFTELLPWLVGGQQVSPQVDRRGRLIVSSGDNNAAGVLTVVQVEIDTMGNIVPTEMGHVYTYDDNGQLMTDTVTKGSASWKRAYTYVPFGPVSDSGWVKQ